ncbi:MAG TPA: UPF0262 family protein [Rhizobiales bacterium]|nr:hypothetical protein BMS3Bbin10_01003 [bacterium BMS3Bbin10]HDO51493.1 UPF0262 family protein [Hyphomicrobiales bacterium]
MGPDPGDTSRLIEIILDEKSVGRKSSDVEHERKVAIFDLLEDNRFALAEREAGPYILELSIAENRLVFAVGDEAKRPITSFMLSLSPFRKIVKDYFLVCETYYEAIKTAPPSRIEALDMGRRGLHNEGSELLMQRLEGKIETDFDTARRLFTLICALHWKG